MTRKLLAGLAVAVLLLAIAEGVLRVALPKERLLFEWERPTGLVSYAEDGRLVTRPDMDEARRDGPYTWRIRLNHLGLREDREVAPGKEPGTVRILALGDSWMFGFSVDQGKTIPDQLERLLPPKMGGAKVEVLNAGVFGSSAFDMLTRYRAMVDTWELDGVLLGQPHNRSRIGKMKEAREAWYGTVSGAPSTDSRIYLGLRRLLAPLRTPMYALPPAGSELDAEVADLRTLAADARGRGLEVWLAEFPNDLEQALGKGFTPDPEWRDALAAEGVVWGGHALGERACWGFLDRGHPSEAGARVIAESVADVIATGASLHEVRATPRCAEVEEVGPTKPGWGWAE